MLKRTTAHASRTKSFRSPGCEVMFAHVSRRIDASMAIVSAATRARRSCNDSNRTHTEVEQSALHLLPRSTAKHRTSGVSSIKCPRKSRDSQRPSKEASSNPDTTEGAGLRDAKLALPTLPVSYMPTYLGVACMNMRAASSFVCLRPGFHLRLPTARRRCVRWRVKLDIRSALIDMKMPSRCRANSCCCFKMKPGLCRVSRREAEFRMPTAARCNNASPL